MNKKQIYRKERCSDLGREGAVIALYTGGIFLLLIVALGMVNLFFNAVNRFEEKLEKQKEVAADPEPIIPPAISNFFSENGFLIIALLGGIIAFIFIIITAYRYMENKKNKKKQLFVKNWKTCFADILNLPDNEQTIKDLKTRIESAIINQDLLLLQKLEAEFDNELIALAKCKELANSTSLDKRNEVIEKVIANIHKKQQILSTTDNQALQMELNILSKEGQ